MSSDSNINYNMKKLFFRGEVVYFPWLLGSYTVFCVFFFFFSVQQLNNYGEPELIRQQCLKHFCF